MINEHYKTTPPLIDFGNVLRLHGMLLCALSVSDYWFS